jgi:SAM-dependent methyltransferase
MRAGEPTMTYPPQLETWWLQAACRATGQDDPEQALLELEAAAGRLSDQFTVSRPDWFQEYASDPRMRAAYGVMFFPQTFARVRVIIDEIRAYGAFFPQETLVSAQDGRADSQHIAVAQVTSSVDHLSASVAPLRVLDLGSGTGASTLAAAISLQDRPLELHAADHASAALETLRRLFDDCSPALCPSATLATHVCDVRADPTPGKFDLIVASFVLNELFPAPDDRGAEAWIQRQIARLSPGGVLAILEPAGADTCERLQRLRNRCARDAAVSIAAPCPHRLPCPMLGAGCGFCHDVRSWHVPDSVNRINRRLFRSLQDVKFGMLALRLAPADNAVLPTGRFRLVAPVSRAKGRLVTRGCCDDGLLREIELPTRHLTRQQLDALLAHERGEFLRLHNGRLLGDGRTWRVEALEPSPSASRRPPP